MKAETCKVLLLLALERTFGFLQPMRIENSSRQSTTQRNNFFTDIGDMLTGGKLATHEKLPFLPPLCNVNSISNEIRSFVVKERLISFTGEDFDVYDKEGKPFVRVRGAMMHLPGKDKMRLRSIRGCDQEVCVLDRVLMAVTPSYDIYRGGLGAEKVAWIEKEVVALTDTFDVYLAANGGIGPFKPPPIYKVSGDFIDRNFVIKNQKGDIVAKVQKDGLIQFDEFNHYQVQVAPGMDAILVIGCICAIDEEFDNEHKKKRQNN